MSQHLLDASAFLALALNERGWEFVADRLETSVIGQVNLAEAVTILAKREMPEAEIRQTVTDIGVPVLGSSGSLAFAVGLLWPRTRKFGCSLGDRYCLATAQLIEATILTSDARLIEAAATVNVTAVPIR